MIIATLPSCKPNLPPHPYPTNNVIKSRKNGYRNNKLTAGAPQQEPSSRHTNAQSRCLQHGTPIPKARISSPSPSSTHPHQVSQNSYPAPSSHPQKSSSKTRKWYPPLTLQTPHSTRCAGFGQTLWRSGAATRLLRAAIYLLRRCSFRFLRG